VRAILRGGGGSGPEADALAIVAAGLRAADARPGVAAALAGGALRAGRRRVRLSGRRRVCVVAYGKAAAAMAEAADAAAPVSDGIVVVPAGSPAPALDRSRYDVVRSSHPLPTRRSVAAARAVQRRVSSLRKGDFALFLVSGGGSAMLAAPDGVSLGEKARTTELLIASGATIREINLVRRRLSSLKGGGLVAGMECDGAALVASDVRGDDPSDVSSGCTVARSAGPADAIAVLKRHRIHSRVPRAALAALRARRPPRRARRMPHVIVASNAACVSAMRSAARSLGYAVRTADSYGDVDGAARRIASALPARRASCVVFGGEPTVRVRGGGRGGRNQELVARLLMRCRARGTVAASIGTDGIDGNTRAAGALAGPGIATAREIAGFLASSDSNALFARRRGLVMTGHTGANVQDIGVLLKTL